MAWPYGWAGVALGSPYASGPRGVLVGVGVGVPQLFRKLSAWTVLLPQPSVDAHIDLPRRPAGW